MSMDRVSDALARLREMESGPALKESHEAQRLAYEGVRRFRMGDHQLAAQLVKRSVALDDMIFLPEGISVIYEQLQ